MTNRTPLRNGHVIENYKILDCISDTGNFGLIYKVEDLNQQRTSIRRVKYSNEFQGTDDSLTVDKAGINFGPTLVIKEFAPKKYCTRVGSNIIPRQGLKENPFAWAKERFEREIRAINKIAHPNIMPIFYGFGENATVYAVMEYVNGGDLDKAIKFRGRQTVEEWYRWMKPVAEALRHIHKIYNINHLDISPDNILFRKNGTPVITDFGFARIGVNSSNNKSRIVKNPHYSAPEKEELTSSHLNSTSDIYSLAAVSLYALTGVDPPSSSGRISKGQEDGVASAILANSNVPIPVMNFLDKAFHLKKEKRFQNWDEYISAMRSAMSSYAEKRETPPPPVVETTQQNDTGVLQILTDMPYHMKLVALTGILMLFIIFLLLG